MNQNIRTSVRDPIRGNVPKNIPKLHFRIMYSNRASEKSAFKKSREIRNNRRVVLDRRFEAELPIATSARSFDPRTSLPNAHEVAPELVNSNNSRGSSPLGLLANNYGAEDDNEAMAVDQDQYDEVYEPPAIDSRKYKSNLAQAANPKSFAELWRLIEPMGKDIKSLKDDVKSLKDDVKSLKDDFKSMKDDFKSMKDDVKSMKDDFKSMKDDFKSMKGDIKSLKSKSQKLSGQISGNATKQAAVHYELLITRWLHLQVEKWWGCLPVGIYGGVFNDSMADYVEAFKRTQRYFNAPQRKSFRALSAAVNKAPYFIMFTELEYNAVGTAHLSELDGALPSLPNKRGSRPGDNVVVMVEMTMMHIDPSAAVVDSFVEYFIDKNLRPTVYEDFEAEYYRAAADAFERQERKADCLKLFNLLLKLVQLEKQVTLQLYHYRCPGATTKDIRKSLRCGLIASSVPSDEVLTKLFASDAIATGLHNIMRLYARDRFKTYQYRLNYASYQ